jgi:hypothetical protein
MSANHSAVIPLGIFLGWSYEKDIETLRIGPIFINEDIRTYHITPGLGHLGTLFDNHALGKKVLKGFFKIDISEIVKRLGNKTGVEEMQYGMFHPSNILIYR